jgi:hypothetical protein
MSVIVKGGIAASQEASVNTSGQVGVIPETNIDTGADRVGAVKIVSENDPGSLTGEMYLKSPETSSDFRLRVGIDTLLFEDSFNATTQNTDLWYYIFATLTAAQPGAGTVNFGTVQGTTSAHGAAMRTFKYFPLVNTAPLAIEFFGGTYIAPMVSGEVWLAGIGLPGSAILPPTDGVFWRLTSGGLEGVLKFNNTETSTGILMAQNAIPLDTQDKWTILIGESEVEWWMGDVLLKEQSIPVGNAQPFLGISAPIFMQKYNTGAVSNTNQIRISRVACSLLDINTNKLWGHQLSSMNRIAGVGQNGHTMGLTAGNFGGAAAIPATQAGSNSTPNAAMAGLGGVFQMTAQASAAGANGDMVASYYLNPVSTINITGRNLIVTGVRIAAINYGAAVATTPTTLLWGVAWGHLGASLALTETASFATGTTHSPRKQPLGFMTAPVGAAIGAVYDKDITVQFQSPICVRPGEYFETTVRFIVGTATSSQTVVYTVMVDGYWE